MSPVIHPKRSGLPLTNIVSAVRRVLPRAAGLGAVLALAGCVSYAGLHGAATPVSPASLETAQSLPAGHGAWPSADWAARFGDAQLAALIDEALAGNPTIGQAQARVERAAAYAQGQHANTLPKVGAQYTLNRQRLSGNGLFPPPLGGNWFTENSVLLNASFELDLWGKNRQALAQAISAQRAAQADAQQARLTLAASVARTYNQLARLYALRAITQREVTERRDIGRLAAGRLNAGLDTQVETRTAQGNVASSQSALTRVDGQITVVRYQLAALLGAGPDRGLRIAVPTLADGGTVDLPDSLPADLVARRPDLVAARWQVDAAAHGIEVAQADFYPNINLMAAAGFDAFGFGRLFAANSRQYQAGPAIHLPIFDAGALRAQLRGRYADLDEAIGNYNHTLVSALSDIATQVASIRSTDQQFADAKAARDAARAAYNLAKIRYSAGLSPQLTVLTADMNLLSYEQNLVELRMDRRDQQIALARALGGGFDARDGELDPAATAPVPAAGPAQRHPANSVNPANSANSAKTVKSVKSVNAANSTKSANAANATRSDNAHGMRTAAHSQETEHDQ